MTRIHLLKPDNEHNKVLKDVRILAFRRDKSLKDTAVKTKISYSKNKGCCGPCKEPRCEIWKYIVPTGNFISLTTKHTYEIRPENLN